MAKKHHDIMKILVKIMAAILSILMIVAVAGATIYYILH